ncbi:fungal-specific transcription factor domain-containing protein [Xylogone sp. PMI_703]|nr:fungal-specific transcription factor domain-containing protein [Xylogone sp. PMI_703]
MATFVHYRAPQHVREQQPTAAHAAHAAQPTRKKRHRITLACNNCRDYKTRCDGRRPVCSRCERRHRGHLCMYEEGALKTKSYVSKLENRLKVLEEERVSSLQKDVRPTTVFSYSEDPSLQQQLYQNVGGSKDSREFERYKSAAPSENTNSPLKTSIIARRPFERGGPCTTSFTRSLIQNLSASSDLLDKQFNMFEESFGEEMQIKMTIGPVHNFSNNTFGFPMRQTADNYIKCFWEVIFPLFPIIHKPLFLEAYERLWDASLSDRLHSGSEDPVFLSTVYIIFAIGCKFSDSVPIARRYSLAYHFYQLSKAALIFDALETTSLPEVQLLLLNAIYLQPTDFSTRCWNTVGMAIRAAQALGLHLEHRGGPSEGQLQREMRLRIWHCCVIFDRLLAVLYNRPTTIMYIKQPHLPQLIDDEYLRYDIDAQQPDGVDSQMALFHISIELFDILGDQMSRVRHINMAGRSNAAQGNCGWSAQDLQDILRLDARLETLFESALNLKLKNFQMQLVSKENDWQSLQINILYKRLLFIRIFLMRPVLLYVAFHSSKSVNNDPQTLSKLEYEMTLKVAAQCISAVHTLVNLKYNDIDSMYPVSPCSPVQYIFAAAIALATARACRVAEPGFDELSLRSSWDQCIRILETYKLQLKQATYALQVMESLNTYIEALNGDRTWRLATPDLSRATANDLGGFDQDIPQDSSLNTSYISNLPYFGVTPSENFDETWFFDQAIGLGWLDSAQFTLGERGE